MYERFFGFEEAPFRLTPDPRYLFLSAKHREALGHLIYGLEDGAGFVAITGEIGAGKTTLVRSFLSNPPERTRYAYILNPVLSGIELVEEINHEFGIEDKGSQRELLHALNGYLVEQKKAGCRVVVVIDEAQALEGAILEQLRMLSNFETETAKLLQIVLVGQPELREILARPELEQLEQRISVRWHLGPLDRKETAEYVAHRVATASGGRKRRIFTRSALRRIFRYTGGVPRRINVLCHRALLVAYARDATTVSYSTIGRAIAEIEAPRVHRGNSKDNRFGWAVTAGALCLVALLAGWSFGLHATVGDTVPSLHEALAGRQVRWEGPSEAAVPPDGPKVAPYPLTPAGPDWKERTEAGVGAAASSVARSPDRVALHNGPSGSGAGEERAILEAVADRLMARRDFPGLPYPELYEASTRSGGPEVPLPLLGERGVASSTVADAAGAKGRDAVLESPVAQGAVLAARRASELARPPEEETRREWIEEAELGEALRQATPTESAYQAIEGLVSAWEAEGLTPAEAARETPDLSAIAFRRGLEYFPLRGNLSLLRVLDLPLIVELDPGDGQDLQFALVDRIDENGVRVTIGRNTLRLSRELFSEVWFGQGHLFWYDVDNLGRLLALGSEGERVERLQQRLRVAGVYPGVGDGKFDEQTRDAVIQFQRNVRLVVDGKAGPMTMAALYAVAAREYVPHLRDSEPWGELDVARVEEVR